MKPFIKSQFATTIPKKKDNVSFSFKKPKNGGIYVEVVVNGFWGSPDIVHLPQTSTPFNSIVKWLEKIITHENDGAVVAEINSGQHGEKNITLNYEFVPNTIEMSETGKRIHSADSGFFYIYDHSSGMMKARSYCDTEDFVRSVYIDMKWDAEKMKHLVYSDIIESYFLNKPQLRFEYKGYFTMMKTIKRDLRYYGEFYEEKAIKGYSFAANNETEARKRFEEVVERIISSEEWKKRNQLWEGSDIDKKSIGCVFDILPEKFKERIESGKFDKALIEGVPGGYYVVPLYYVTKAWEVLLKDKLEHYAFMIGPEEDDEDDYEVALKEFMEEEHATRTRCGACRDNDKMKDIWKEMLGVDLDAIDVDFTQFNRHFPPNVSEQEYEEYFFDVPDGVFEWVLGGVNRPNGQCTFDSVSALMEFTALIVKERKEWN